MERIDGLSFDIKSEKINKIKDLFPEYVINGKVNLEKLIKDFSDNDILLDDEKYCFLWNGKSDSKNAALSRTASSLIPCKDKSVNWDKSNNLYIEGDNLEVLKTLQKTFFGNIDVIYIDPPYNTGNDFIYKDDYANSLENYKQMTNQTNRVNPESSGRYHTDWLNMMYCRLILASNLLSKNGAIFISIDDNEVFNLKKLCDEVFGENNFITMFTWIKTTNPPSLGSKVRDNMEYVLCYEKNFDSSFKLYGRESNQKDSPLANGSNKVNTVIIPAGSCIFPNFKNGLVPSGNKPADVILLDDITVNDNKNINDFRITFKSKWNQENIYSEVSTGTCFFVKDHEYFSIRYQKGNIDYVVPDKYLDPTKFDVKDNEYGRKEVERLIGKVGFDYPKNTPLLKTLLKMYLRDKKEAIVMDFFSGSGTTADAVMQLNAEDGGNRKFIMVQLPEPCEDNSNAKALGYNTICDIAEARIRTAGEDIYKTLMEKKESSGLFTDDFVNPDLLDLGFKVFKLDSSNIRAWDATNKLDEHSIFEQLETIKEDRTNLDVAYEIMLKYGVFNMPLEEVTINNKPMFNVGKGFLIIDLNNEITLQDVEAIGKEKPHCVVFKESGFGTNDNVKLNAVKTLQTFGVDDIKCL